MQRNFRAGVSGRYGPMTSPEVAHPYRSAPRLERFHHTCSMPWCARSPSLGPVLSVRSGQSIASSQSMPTGPRGRGDITESQKRCQPRNRYSIADRIRRCQDGKKGRRTRQLLDLAFIYIDGDAWRPREPATARPHLQMWYAARVPEWEIVAASRLLSQCCHEDSSYKFVRMFVCGDVRME
jgi:hypothetical protein